MAYSKTQDKCNVSTAEYTYMYGRFESIRHEIRVYFVMHTMTAGIMICGTNVTPWHCCTWRFGRTHCNMKWDLTAVYLAFRRF